eukprot:GHVP01055542.1.p1 GENE.GHVP01055542.1~~GHVP01055542.1.p1  ORF type:complete len:140 (+),score=37.33 GHVP01055542.1:341-760(+)
MGSSSTRSEIIEDHKKFLKDHFKSGRISEPDGEDLHLMTYEQFSIFIESFFHPPWLLECLDEALAYVSTSEKIRISELRKILSSEIASEDIEEFLDFLLEENYTEKKLRGNFDVEISVTALREKIRLGPQLKSLSQKSA